MMTASLACLPDATAATNVLLCVTVLSTPVSLLLIIMLSASVTYVYKINFVHLRF